MGAILVVEMVLLACFTPMKFNRQAMRCSGKDSRKVLAISAVISLLIVAALVGFRLYMNAKNPVYREIPLFGLYLNVHTRWLYPFNIVFQEFFIKAFAQENIGIALRGVGTDNSQNGSNRIQTVLTALITAMFFFVLHLQYPLYYMTGAFFTVLFHRLAV